MSWARSTADLARSTGPPKSLVPVFLRPAPGRGGAAVKVLVSSARRSASAVGQRSSGSFARQRITVCDSSFGVSVRLRSTGTGSSVICFISSIGTDPAWNGSSPVSIWYATTPSEYRSERPSISRSPAACSGLMNAGVPIATPASVSVPPSDDSAFGDTEVRHHHPAARALEQDVVGLHVAMNDALRVGGGERVSRLLHHSSRFFDGEPAAPLEPQRQRLAVHVAHDEVDQVILVADGMDRNDIGMGQPRRRLGFAQKALADVGAEGEFGRENLDRDGALQPLVARGTRRPCRRGRSHPRSCRRYPELRRGALRAHGSCVRRWRIPVELPGID